MKINFWKLGILYINGGIYADIDVRPIKPI